MSIYAARASENVIVLKTFLFLPKAVFFVIFLQSSDLGAQISRIYEAQIDPETNCP